MLRRFTRITIIRRIVPEEMTINEELQAFSDAVGLFSERDKEKSCFRVFISLLREHHALTSDEIATIANLSRATVIHHLNRLMDSGLAISTDDGKYALRAYSFEELADHLEEDVHTYFRELRKLGAKIDEDLGL